MTINHRVVSRLAAATVASAMAVALSGPAFAQSVRTQAIQADLPPGASPNACYARVFIPPKTEERPRRVEVRPAHQTLQVRQPTYRQEFQDVVIKPGYRKVEYTAPVFRTEIQEVIVEPERIEYEVVQPVFRTEKQSVKIRERYESWNDQCTPLNQIAGATGEVLCRTVNKPEFIAIDVKVVDRPARLVQKRVVPAKKRRFKVEVMVRPAQERVVNVPPVVERIAVTRVASPVQQAAVQVPAQTRDIPLIVPVTEGRVEWRETLCADQTSNRLVARVQRELRRRNYNPGPVDGVLGPRTLAALRSFQRREGLTQGGLLLETLQALGVRAG